MEETDKEYMRLYYWKCALHAGWKRLETHKQNMTNLLLFHANNIYNTAQKCYGYTST